MATKPPSPPSRPFTQLFTPNHSNRSNHGNPAVESERMLALKAAVQAGLIGPVQLRLPGF
jgi:hypothetical protein